MNESIVPSLVVCLATGIAAAMDLRRFRVANRFTLALFVSGLAYAATVGGWPGLGRSVTGALFAFALLIVPYAGRGMGAGDVKLGAGVGAWLGPMTTFDVLVAAAVATVVYAVVLTLATGRVRETIVGVKRLMAVGAVEAGLTVDRLVDAPDRRRRLVPFAAMMALGMIVTMARRWITTGHPIGMASL